MISLIGLVQDITTFSIVKCRQIKILKKTARFGVSNSPGTQNRESATETLREKYPNTEFFLVRIFPHSD